MPAPCREQLEKLGPLSLNEKITAGALGTTVLLWIFGGSIGIGNVGAALLGLTILLVTNVTTWKECLGGAMCCCACRTLAAAGCFTSGVEPLQDACCCQCLA